MVPDAERTTFEDLATIILDDYKANERHSLRNIVYRLKTLGAVFGMDRAVDITADRIVAYVAQRREACAAAATINRELALLRRAFRLAARVGKVASRPEIDLLREDNT
jgi:site-specific recombinase XerD